MNWFNASVQGSSDPAAVAEPQVTDSSNASSLKAVRSPLSARAALALRRRRAEARRAKWYSVFSRYLPFTGWRVPEAVESAINRFQRRFGGGASQQGGSQPGVLPLSSRKSRLRIDYDRGIWRTSTLEQFEKKMLLSISVGHLDEGYVDDSWQAATAGQEVIWRNAAGEEVPLVYGFDAFSSLADGVAATNEGGILNIAEGSYSEILATHGKGLTIRAGGDAVAEVAIDGLLLGSGDTLDFDAFGIDSHDRFSLAAGASVFELGSARLNVAESADLAGDGASVLGLLTSEKGISVGPTGTVYDRLGRNIAQETILSSSRLNFRFEKESGEFQGVFLTPLTPPTTVFVDSQWADLLVGDPVAPSAGTNATFGYDAFADLDEAAALVGEGGTINATADFLGSVLPASVRAGVVLDVAEPMVAPTLLPVPVMPASGGLSFGGELTATNAATLVVGPGETYTTIQAAINAASAGDTIQVLAGTYTGGVNVSKTLTIVGPNAGISGDGSRVAEAVVEGSILVNANGVTISGLSIDGTNVDQGPALSMRGILVGNTRSQSDVTITDNVISNWVTGISLAGGGTPGWVNNVVMTGNRLVNNGIGSTENATSLTIQNNVFDNGGFGLGGGATMAAAISGNTFTGGSSRYVGIANGVTLFDGQTLGGIVSANTFDKAAALSAAAGQWYSQAIFATISGAVTAAATGLALTRRT